MMTKCLAGLSILMLILSCETTRSTLSTDQETPIKNNTNRIWNQGWVSVPEKRTNNRSNLIKLPFILSKATDSLNEKGAPILIMSGGPGNSSLHMANGVVNTPWGKSRDIIVYEQRGTIHASPTLTCPEIDSLRILGIKSGLYGENLDSLKMQGIQSCYERLIAQGVDLSGYNSLETVEDIEALRKLLRIEKLILYGMSYSCNLMTAYAQTYPKHTTALILDSPLPHQTNYDEEAYQNIDSTLIKVIKHYSGSKQLYYQWINYLSSVKDSVFQISSNSQIYKYTKNELIDIILFKMSSHNSLKETTVSLLKIIEGNHEEIYDVINYYLETSNQALGMRYSLWVGEELTEESEDIISQEKMEYSWLHDYPVNDVSFKTGRIWKIESLYEKRKWPDSSYFGPTLILSGEFDPWTPEWYGYKMFKYLPNAKHVIYPEYSHLPGFTSEGFKEIDNFIGEVEQGIIK